MGEFSAHAAAVAHVLTHNNSKNLKIQMGRCPVRSIFPEALEVLAKNQEKFR